MRRLIVGGLVFAVGAAGCAATPEAVQTLTDTTAASATSTSTAVGMLVGSWQPPPVGAVYS